MRIFEQKYLAWSPEHFYCRGLSKTSSRPYLDFWKYRDFLTVDISLLWHQKTKRYVIIETCWGFWSFESLNQNRDIIPRKLYSQKSLGQNHHALEMQSKLLYLPSF